MGWLTDIRKISRIAFLALGLGTVYPLWTETRQIISSTFMPQDLWLRVGLFMFLFLLAALPLAFLFARYRNQAPLQISQPLRRLALCAALLFAGITALQVVEWIRSEGPYFDSLGMLNWAAGSVAVRAAQNDPRTLDFLSTAVNEAANAAYLLMLIAFFRAPDQDPDEEIPVDRLLRRVNRVALSVGYIMLAVSLVSLAYTPYLYRSTHENLGPGSTSSTLELLAPMIFRLLTVMSLIAAPFIVSRSLPQGSQELQELRDADSDVLPG